MGLMDLLNQGDVRDKIYAAASKNNVPQGGITGAMFKGMFPHGLGNLAFGRQPEPMPQLDSPQGTAYMADLASNMAVPGTFIGPKGMSNLLGDDVARGLLSSAEAKLAQGVPKETVFSELGVFRGPEGKWRYEIDDSGLTVDISRLGPSGHSQMAARDAVSNRDLFRAYDEIGDYETSVQRGLMRGGFTPPEESSRFGNDAGRFLFSGMDKSELADVAVHELQHAVQAIEGFVGGGNADFLGRQKYVNLPGEIEARAAAARRRMGNNERRAVFPEYVGASIY